MPRAIYNNFKGKPLNVQVVFALTQAHVGKEEQFILGRDDFAVSGVGICPDHGVCGATGRDQRSHLSCSPATARTYPYPYGLVHWSVQRLRAECGQSRANCSVDRIARERDGGFWYHSCIVVTHKSHQRSPDRIQPADRSSAPLFRNPLSASPQYELTTRHFGSKAFSSLS